MSALSSLHDLPILAISVVYCALSDFDIAIFFIPTTKSYVILTVSGVATSVSEKLFVAELDLTMPIEYC